MAQKALKVLAFRYGMQKRMIEETGIPKPTIWFACSGKSHSDKAMEIRNLAIKKYGAFIVR